MGAWQFTVAATSPSLVELPRALYCLVVCRFSGESLAYASDDGVVVGIIFLVEGITMIEDLNLQD